MSGPLVVYGAYGYTGELVARRAVERGLTPVLAGRDSEPLANLARELSCPWRAFPLSDPESLRRGIAGAGAVLHCAGPFVDTARPMAEACIDERVHYLDITGEIPVFEALLAMGPAAQNAGVMLLPGAGFDIVPSDCLAAHLVRRLPAARSLVLAIAALDRISRGTARTMLAHAGAAGAFRSAAPAKRTFDLGAGRVTGVAVPWADTFTAPRSTGVPDVTVYLAANLATRAMLAVAPAMAPLLASRTVREAVAALMTRGERGPGPEERAGRTAIYGEALDASGRRVASIQRHPEGYALTALVGDRDRGARPARRGEAGLADAVDGVRAGPRPRGSGRGARGPLGGRGPSPSERPQRREPEARLAAREARAPEGRCEIAHGVPLRPREEAPGPQGGPERLLDPRELGVGRAGGPRTRGRGRRLDPRATELPCVHEHRLREVQGGLLRRGRDRGEGVAAIHLGVREPAPLVAEHDRGRPLPGAGERLARDLLRREPPLAADAPRGRGDHPGAVGDRLVERRDDPRAVEEVLGVDRDAARGGEVVGPERGDRPVLEAEVPHHARDGAQVFGVPRPDEDDPHDAACYRDPGRSPRSTAPPSPAGGDPRLVIPWSRSIAGWR